MQRREVAQCEGTEDRPQSHSQPSARNAAAPLSLDVSAYRRGAAGAGGQGRRPAASGSTRGRSVPRHRKSVAKSFEKKVCLGTECLAARRAHPRAPSVCAADRAARGRLRSGPCCAFRERHPTAGLRRPDNAELVHPFRNRHNGRGSVPREGRCRGFPR